MRINKYVAQASGLSRRAADVALEQGRVRIGGQPAQPGQQVPDGAAVTLDGTPLHLRAQTQTIMLNKPVGYVVSRDGQGSKTIYDLLPPELHHLKPVGRLDKDSSGLLLLTDDGQLAHELTHPRHQKTKVYEVTLNKPLTPEHQQQISQQGIQLEDGPSQLQLQPLDKQGKAWQITMSEGRNRQIRRTFKALGYEVQQLNRTHFGTYALPDELGIGGISRIS
jgi:23S rRNA pseudouridine2605 synthase